MYLPKYKIQKEAYFFTKVHLLERKKKESPIWWEVPHLFSFYAIILTMSMHLSSKSCAPYNMKLGNVKHDRHHSTYNKNHTQTTPTYQHPFHLIKVNSKIK